jgi:superfamily I DNA and/or RNA helicase
LKFVRGGGKLSPKELDAYLKVVDTEWKRVFDEARGPTTVITTSNNAHILAMFTKWKPDLSIVDEAALGMEGDSLIPLSMRPTRVFLVGDHKQLKPIILSADQNEYSDQAETSLFKRLVDCGLHCYRLEINYRMHWRISLFPAAITYDHLGNGAKQTLEEEQQTEVEVEDGRVDAIY